MRYWDITIWSLDQEYIDRISDLYDIDYYDADVYLDEDLNNASITNQLIYYILTEAVNNLDISDKNKEFLQDKIYCNCLDSWFNFYSDDVYDEIEWTDEEKEIIKKFLDL